MPHFAWCLPLAFFATLSACGPIEPRNSAAEGDAKRARALAQRMKAACASDATYARLKQVAFDDAIRIRNADPVNLDQLSTHSLARVENPVVKSRDEALDVTVCSGRFILQIPPGAERAFEGKRQLVAEVEYAAQAAADGSGMVYRMKGAEPIVYSLAAFDLRAQDYRRTSTAPAPSEVVAAESRGAEEPVRTAQATPLARPQPVTPRAQPQSPPRPKTQSTQRPRTASPSFNCRAGRSRSEQMVCNNERLASLDRQMSAQFYAELDRGDQRARAELRRSRDRFLASRERCGDQQCVERAYRDRMDEIDDIASGR